MTQLSNSNLLNEEVLQGNLKQERMKQVSETANKPVVTEMHENVIPMNPPVHNMGNMNQNVQNFNTQNQENKVNNNYDDFDEDKYAFNNTKNKMNTENKKTEKILGMPKGVAIGLGVLLLAGVSYLAYRHFIAKKTSAKAPATGGSSKEATKEVAKESVKEAVKETATATATAATTETGKAVLKKVA